ASLQLQIRLLRLLLSVLAETSSASSPPRNRWHFAAHLGSGGRKYRKVLIINVITWIYVTAEPEEIRSCRLSLCRHFGKCRPFGSLVAVRRHLERSPASSSWTEASFASSPAGPLPHRSQRVSSPRRAAPGGCARDRSVRA